MLVSLLGATAFAQQVEFDLDDAAAQSLGLDTADLEDQLGTAITEELNLSDPDSYISKYANAVAMSTKGMGVDYASNPTMFSVGAAVGTAVSGVPVSFSRGPQDLPDGGYAFMAALHAGLNLGVLVPGDDKTVLDHVLVYVSGLGFNPPGNREFSASMYNFGAHGQIDLGGVKSGSMEWGGVALTAGYERSWYKLSLGQALPITQEVSPATITWSAEGTYDLSATADTIPVEISTNLRVAVVTAWVGGGVDIVNGSATSEAALAGPVSATAAGQQEDLGTIGVSLDGTGAADLQVPRLFLGVQGNIFALKAFGQLNIGFNETYGGFVGLRVAM